MEDIDYIDILPSYAETADPNVLAEMVWEGMRRAIGRGQLSFTEAEVQFYIRHSKGLLGAQDASITTGFQAQLPPAPTS